MKSLDQLNGPSGIPFFGNLFQVKADEVHRSFENWADHYGEIFKVRLGPRRFVVVSDAEAIRFVFLERPELFRRDHSIEEIASEMQMKGVFAAEGDDWRRQRRLTVSAFSSSRIRQFFPKLTETVDRLRNRWMHAADADTAVDLCRDLTRLTVDVTSQFAFGIDGNTLETDGPVIQRNLDKVFPHIHRRTSAIFPYWRYIRLPKDREMERALDELREQVEEIIQAVRKRVEDNPNIQMNPANFLETIIVEAQSGDKGFSDEEIFANVCTLLLAGEDTTANTLAWSIYYLIRHPECFTRVRQEVDSAIAPGFGVQAYEQVSRLPYLDAFVLEVMRMKPVAPMMNNEANEDVELLGFKIPKGTSIVLLTRQLTQKECHFGSPGKFDPDRWLLSDDERRCPHQINTYFPFGGGPRFCPGRSLATMQLRSVLAMACRNFEFELASSQIQVKEKFEFTMYPANLSVKIHKRVGL